MFALARARPDKTYRTITSIASLLSIVLEPRADNFNDTDTLRVHN